MGAPSDHPSFEALVGSYARALENWEDAGDKRAFADAFVEASPSWPHLAPPPNPPITPELRDAAYAEALERTEG
jgi:predicted RNA polymerase sigma factor